MSELKCCDSETVTARKTLHDSVLKQLNLNWISGKFYHKTNLRETNLTSTAARKLNVTWQYTYITT